MENIQTFHKKQDFHLNSRVLVVGGAGFIGGHVVRQLVDAGAKVTIMDTVPVAGALNSFGMVIGSVADTSLFASAASGCEMVVFLANSSLPASANTDLAAEVEAHVKVTVKAAEICKTLGVSRFLFASSGGTVYGYSSQEPLHEDMPTRPLNAYGVSKLAIEHYLRLINTQGEMNTVSLRISNPYGEKQRALRNQGIIAAAIQHALNGRVLPIWGDGSVERDFIHVSDVARAFVAACCAESPPNVVNIGSGVAISLLQVLSGLEATLGHPITVEFEPGRDIDVARNVLDVTLARKTLGWSPRISIDEGLRRTVDWWRVSNKDHNAA